GPPGYGSLIRAAKAAGYGGDNDLHASQMAVQLMHNDKVQAALKELGHKRINAAAFSVIKNVEAIANNLAHPQCLKAAEMLLNRGGFGIETTHHVTIEHKVDYQKQALEELATFLRLGVAREQLEQIYGRDGLFHLEQQLDPGKLIDGKVESEAD